MKKVLSALLIALFVLSLASCKKNETPVDPEPTPVERTYKADGEYIAFEAQLNSGAPQVTWVTVTIENDAIKSYKINTLQSNSLGEGKYQWNEQNKVELGWKYGMFRYTPGSSFDIENTAAYQEWCQANDKLEWFQQAALIEAKLLADGADSIQLNNDGYFTNVTGVSIKDNAYVALAKKAVQNAKDGKVIALTPTFYSGNVELDWATATIDANHKATAVEIDSLQPQVTKGGTDAEPTYTFAWKGQTKRELGWKYGMFRYNPGSSFDMENTAAYQEWCQANDKLEWFQQVDLLSAHWLAGGSFTVEGGKVTNVAGCTINDFYTAALAKLLAMGVTR